jgi:hypothetical protein
MATNRESRNSAAANQPAALRGLVGSGPSQLSTVKAMRVRDINRPTEDDLRAAKDDLVIVRRHWAPQ